MDIDFSVIRKPSESKLDIIQDSVRSIFEFAKYKPPDDLPEASFVNKISNREFIEPSENSFVSSIPITKYLVNFTPYRKTFKYQEQETTLNIHPAIIIQNLHNSILDFDDNFTFLGNFPRSISSTILDELNRSDNSIIQYGAPSESISRFLRSHDLGFIKELKDFYPNPKEFEYAYYYTTFMVFYYLYYNGVYIENGCKDLQYFFQEVTTKQRDNFTPSPSEKKTYQIGLNWTNKVQVTFAPPPPSPPGPITPPVKSPKPKPIPTPKIVTMAQILEYLDKVVEDLMILYHTKQEWLKFHPGYSGVNYYRNEIMPLQTKIVEKIKIVKNSNYVDLNFTISKRKLLLLYEYVFSLTEE